MEYSKDHWVERLTEFVPRFCAEHPALSRHTADASAIFHGSMAAGLGDEFADLDVWLLLSDAESRALEDATGTRFFSFVLDGVEGHLNAEPIETFAERVTRCHMDTIYQLRRSAVISDATGAAQKVVALARRSMPDEVRKALFRYHYVEMRGEHRACDNPMERHEPVGALLSLTKVVAHALRAAMVLDGEPYPYDKWLYYAALQTPTGKLVGPSVDEIVHRLATDALRFDGREADNPISIALHSMRRTLVGAARAKGMDESWLDRWWVFMTQAQDAMNHIRWE